MAMMFASKLKLCDICWPLFTELAFSGKTARLIETLRWFCIYQQRLIYIRSLLNITYPVIPNTAFDMSLLVHDSVMPFM